MTFPLRTFCSYKTGLSQDLETAIIANILRMKESQLIVAGTSGCVEILKVSSNPSVEDMVVNHETGLPILGICVGIFSAAHNSLDENEKLELAVIHPNSFEILVPKKSEQGTVELEEVVEHEASKIVAFTVIHKAEIGYDENRNKRQFIQSYMCIKTLDSELIIAQRKIVAKVKLGFRYAMPSPITYSPLSDLLIISTFEYSIIAIEFSELLEQENSVVEDKETQTNLKVVFEFVLNDRIQSLECGRFFRSDSAKTGEICVILTRELVFIDCSGKIVREIKFDTPIINCVSVYSKENKYTEVLSLLVLEKHRISILSSGVLRFSNQFQEYSVEIPREIDETSENLGSMNSSKHGSEYDDEEDDFIINKPMEKAPILPKSNGNPVPLKGIKMAKLNVLNYPVNIIASETISEEFNASNHNLTEPCSDELGLFALCYANGTINFCYFGTSNYNFKLFSPIALPSNEASKLLKEELTEELKGKRLSNKTVCEERMEGRIIGISAEQTGIEIEIEVLFESSNDLLDVTCHCVIGCESEVHFQGPNAADNVAYIEEFSGLRQQTFKCTLFFKVGKFVAPQNVHLLVSSVFVDDEPERMRVSIQIPLPLFAHNITGIMPSEKFRYEVDVLFETPCGTLGEFLRKRDFNIEIANSIGENALAIKNLDGSVCLVERENNSTIRIASDKIEQLYAGIDFVLSDEQSYALKCDGQEISQGLIELTGISKKTETLALEDRLSKILEVFESANQEIITQLHAAVPSNFVVEGVNGRNVGESIEILADYIDGVGRIIRQQDGGNSEHIERIKGVASLLVALRYKGMDEIQKQRSVMCAFDSLSAFEQMFGNIERYLGE